MKLKAGMIVRTLRGVGHRGNWKAQGAKLWRVVGTFQSSLYRSGICVELMPLDRNKPRKWPLRVDRGLVASANLRIETKGEH